MSIRAKQRYYNWCVEHGFNVVHFDLERMNFDLPKKHKSSFKKRAAEVKEKFNHTFKFREQDFLNGYPNIENVQFVKK